jgi:hypothetical protein
MRGALSFVAWSAVAVVGLAMLGICAGSGGDGAGASGPRDRRPEAWQVCKQFVEEKLKAPSSADFPSRFAPGIEIVRLEPGDEFEIVGYVDAQNSFGAMLRNHYICVVRHLGGGNSGSCGSTSGRRSGRAIAGSLRKRDRSQPRPAAEQRAMEAEERKRVAEEKRIADETARERNRLAVLARRQRDEQRQREIAALMPEWHPTYRREIAPVRAAVGAVTSSWASGERGVTECSLLQAALTRVDRQAIRGAPDPEVSASLPGCSAVLIKGRRSA